MVLFAVISFFSCMLFKYDFYLRQPYHPSTDPSSGIFYIHELLFKKRFRHEYSRIGGVMVYQLASGMVDRGFEPKNIKLVSFASPLSTPY